MNRRNFMWGVVTGVTALTAFRYAFPTCDVTPSATPEPIKFNKIDLHPWQQHLWDELARHPDAKRYIVAMSPRFGKNYLYSQMHLRAFYEGAQW